MNPIISIIIPHYNSLRTLGRTLNSIPNRHWIEVIVIDNSPQPISKGIIPGVSRDFDLVFSSPERGAGGARNVGIEKSVGEFLIFMDSDDYLTPEAVVILDDFVSMKEKPDIIFFDVVARDSETGSPSKRADFYNKLFKDYEKNPSEISKNRILYRYTTPWSKIYKRDFLITNNIRFDEVPASNDVMFTEYASFHASSVLISNKVLYTVTTCENSLTRTPSVKNLKSRFSVQMRQSAFLRSIGKYEYALVPFDLLKKIYEVDKQSLYWALKEMVRYRVNPFTIIYQKYKKHLKKL